MLMKNNFQSNVNGQMLDGGSIEHPLSIHSASIGTRWKPRGMQLICTLVLLFTFAIGNVWAADPDLAVGATAQTSSTFLGEYSTQGLTLSSSASYSSGVVQIGNTATAYNQHYFEVLSSGAEIEKVSFLISGNGSNKSIQAPVFAWATTATGNTADTYVVLDAVNVTANSYAAAQWFEYDLSSASVKCARIYRTTKNISSTDPAYTGSSTALGSGQTIKIYGVKVWLKKKVTINPDGGSTETTGWTLSEGKYIKSGIVSGTSVTLPTMTKGGNTFNGWKNKNNEDVASPITITKDTVLTAQWVSSGATSHAISYTNTKGASTAGLPTEYYEGVGVASFAALADVEGFHFTGWSPSSIAADATTDPFEVEAQWVVAYNVTFNSNGGTAVDAQKVVSEETATEPTAPTREMYTFAGWYKGEDAFDFATPITANTELTAHWTPNYFTESVDFEEDGSSAVSGIASKNIVASNAGSYDGGKASENWAYKGWKIKSNGATVKVLVQANKKLTFKFGYLAATAHVAISGDATNYSVTGASKVEDDPLKFTTYSWTKNYDALYTFTTGSGDAAVIKALTVQDTYTATRVDGKSDGAGSDANVLETTLPTPTAISGWTFTGWIANEDVKAGEDTKTAGTVLAAGTYTLLANTTFTAQWAEASSTYDITYVSAHGTAPAADNAASVVLAELDAEGWAHKGWTANADVTVDAATVEAGTLIANGKTAILESNVTFTAVWKEIFTVTFDSKGGSAVDPIDVEDGATLAAAPADPTKDDCIFLGWSETEDGDVVADITALTITANKTLYAKWELDVQVTEIVFSNGFKGWIVNNTVTVFYMEGESAPTIASYAGKNLKAEGGVVISGDKIIATGTDDSEIEFALTMTEVTPLSATGTQTFDGTEGYVKTRHAWTSDKKWKMSKYAEDGRVARGETSMYIFLGAAESVTLDWGAQKVTNDVAVYVNGTFVKNIGKNNNSAIALSNGNNMVAMYSLQTSGDIWLNGLTVAPWVPVTAVALKEGEDAISSKEIWESTSFTLTAEVTPDNASNKTITWTSSNEAVATVENGVVTGVAASADPVTITASTVDGVNATCVVTVTTAPQPSADPVITAQPQSANYYEGATIAALEVVATGESLTYQWYLGSEAIEGAIAATYQPTVSAIGSYVYHCVVTNTEAGNLPTSLASDNATITIADDPAAIKLLDGEGNVNTTNFTTGVTAGTVNFDDADHKCASFGSTGSSIVGLTGLNKVVAYNATTTQTKVKFVLYNTNSSAKELYLQKVLEDATVAVTETISVPSKELYETQYYTYNSSDLRSFYVTVNSTNIKVLQVKVIDNGTALKRAGEAGYELNLNQGRVFGAQNIATNFEGLAFAPSSNAKVLNSTELPITTPLSFTIAAPLTLKVTTSAAKYYVSQNASEDGTTATAVTSAGEEEFDLTVAGTWYIVPSTTSAVKLTNLAFALPKAAKPVVADMDNVEYCQGSAIDALTVSATVSDGGTMLYQWYKDGDAISGAEAATYQPTADGEYYVVVVNTKADHQNSDPTQSNTITVTGYAATVLSGTTGAEDWPGADATISVEASGKNLSYAWYTCDDAMGTNPVAVEPAVNAAELDVTVGAADTYYKVVVSGDCGDAQEAVITVVARQAVDLQDVTGDMSWDFSKANDGSAATDNLCNDEVLANVHGIVNNSDFTSDNIKATAKKFKSGKLQASMIKFHTTVDGMITVVFSNTGSKSQDRYLTVNGRKTDKGSKTETAVTYTGFVYAGDVELGVVEGDGNMLNFTSVDFKATVDYPRTVNPAYLGTLCWTNNAVLGGATLYEFAGKNENNYLVFDEVEENRLEAGKPYIFMPENGNTEIKLYNTDNAEPLTEDQDPVNHMYGTLTGKTLVPGQDDNMYYFSASHIWAVKDFVVNINVPAYYCYVDYVAVLAGDPAPAPAQGRRRVTMGTQGSQVATGMDAIKASDKPMKLLINGQIFILCGEKMYDVTGRLVK